MRVAQRTRPAGPAGFSPTCSPPGAGNGRCGIGHSMYSISLAVARAVMSARSVHEGVQYNRCTRTGSASSALLPCGEPILRLDLRCRPLCAHRGLATQPVAVAMMSASRWRPDLAPRPLVDVVGGRLPPQAAGDPDTSPSATRHMRSSHGFSAARSRRRPGSRQAACWCSACGPSSSPTGCGAGSTR